MAVMPPLLLPPGQEVTISSGGPLSVGLFIGSMPSAVWPSANLAIFVPFRLPAPLTVQSLWVLNGATASGNIDVGIYDYTGTKLVSTGSTAQSGTNVVQSVGVTAVLGAGLFYLALAMNNTTGTIARFAPANVGLVKAAGLAEAASAFPLPATTTLSTVSNAYMPLVGLSGRSVV